MELLSQHRRCLYPRRLVRPHDVCPHRTSHHLPERLLLGHHYVGIVANCLLCASDSQYQVSRVHGLLLWLVRLDSRTSFQVLGPKLGSCS